LVRRNKTRSQMPPLLQSRRSKFRNNGPANYRT
jgi:hypothetical protein